MDIISALSAFNALSQETRLGIFRLLVEHGMEGAAAGVLSDTLDIPHNTLSFHLSHLSQAGLVTSQRDGRRIIYKANLDAMQSLVGF
ncbi:ArsR/SmtB family transcription factor, partial [Staphylococcus aureus]